MKEPSVSIQMIAESIPVTTVAGTNIAAGVVLADCGTLNPRVFYSSTEVLKEFTKSGELSRTADTTLVHAAAIADIMPILLKRSYKDDGTRAGFGVYKHPLVVSDNTDTWDSEFLTEHEAELQSTGVTLHDDAMGLDVALAKLDGSVSGIKEMTFTMLNNFNQVSFNANAFQYAFIEDPYGNEYYIAAKDITKVGDISTFSHKKLIKNNTLHMVFDAGILYSLQFASRTEDTYLEMFFKNDTPLPYKSVLTFSEEPNPITFKILAGTEVFYNELQDAPTVPSGITPVGIENITKYSTTREILDMINFQLKTGYIDYDGTNYILYTEEPVSAASGNYSNSQADSEEIIPTGQDFSLFVIANFPSNVDYTAKVNPDPENEDQIEIVVQTATRTYDYTGSTDPEYVNDYGKNQYIENINEYENIPFKVIVVLDDQGNPTEPKDFLTTPTIAFGRMNIGRGTSNAVRKACVEELIDQDEVKIAFGCPLGYNNDGYLTKLVNSMQSVWAFTPVGMYVFKDDPEQIIANRPTLQTEYAMIMTPHDKSTRVTDWQHDMTLEVCYLAKIMSNAAKRSEFAPMVGKDNSTLDITKPSVVLKKTTREKLLDVRIMSLISRNNRTTNYLNKNKCSGGNTVLSEDQNVRLACKINRDLDTLLEPIIGKFNTEETRDLVSRMIRQYFRDNILNQNFSIDSYEIICDASNNPASVRANNQLVVDLSVVYLNTIYEVVIFHRALSVLSQDEGE